MYKRNFRFCCKQKMLPVGWMLGGRMLLSHDILFLLFPLLGGESFLREGVYVLQFLLQDGIDKSELKKKR